MNDLRLLQNRRMLAPDGTGGAAPAAEPEQGAAKTGREGAEATPAALTQADVDRIVAREKAKLQKGYDTRLAAAIKEAETRAQMTAEERAKADAERAAHELAQREAAITRRELRAQALETLAAGGLPKGLADTLNYTDADACAASLEAVKKAFTAAVAAGINDKLRQPPPKAGAAAGTEEAQLAAVRKAMGLK